MDVGLSVEVGHFRYYFRPAASSSMNTRNQA